MIRTVLGDIPCDSLGHTQCHEHLFLAKGKSYDINTALCMEDAEKSGEELHAYRQAGGNCLVDAQPGAGCGRMEQALVNAALSSGCHILAVTGFHRPMFYYEDAPIFSLDEGALAKLFASEVTQGMLQDDGTRLAARAGIVKVALEQGGVYASSLSEKLFGAAAQAASISGAPVMAHTEPGTDVLEMIGFFSAAGIAPGRLIICHLDRTHYDTDYHQEVLASGAFLCYDSVNRLKYLSHESEIALIKAMLSAGYENQLLLSLDTTNQRLRAYGADMGLDYILTTYVPMLRAAGVPDAQISAMTAQNAREALRLQ